jgi:hypothetical protein
MLGFETMASDRVYAHLGHRLVKQPLNTSKDPSMTVPRHPQDGHSMMADLQSSK